MKFTTHFCNRKAKASRGFTLSELTIAMVLMSFVVFLAGSLVNLAARGFVGSEIKQGIVQEDTAFAAKLTESIQKSTVGFTVPYQSFNNVSKLTAGWNYLGLMENVHIPAAASRTGREIASAQALVYIEYYGDSAPSKIPADCNLIHNSGGYFIQKVLGHAFTDNYGMTYTYSLEFKPTNPQNTAAQSIIYEFSSLVNGEGMTGGGSKEMDIDSMLSCLNAIQVVYKGSDTNPAVALAFRGDFLPTWSAQQASTSQPPATIVMILDLSSSMTDRFSNTTRVEALRKTAIDFVDQFSANPNMNIIVVPFSNVACEPGCYSGSRVPAKHIYNASSENAKLKSVINSLQAYSCTNPGDGIRVGYVLLKQLRNSGADMGQCFMILMTDGMMNEMTDVVVRRYTKRYGYCFPVRATPYYGEEILTSDATWYGWPSISSEAQCVYDYVTYWGNKMVNEFQTKNYLIGMNDSMNNKDGELLRSIFSAESINVNNLTEFQTVWEDIGSNIEEVMWAFEGPNL